VKYNRVYHNYTATEIHLYPFTAIAVSGISTNIHRKESFMPKLISFLHPTLMWGVLGLYLYTAYLGWQSSRLKSVNAETRKELVRNKVGLKHYQVSSVLLGLLVLGSALGLAVTYINVGTVFNETHGKIGMLMMVLIALAASLAPFLQRGAAWARISHVSIGIVLLILYLWEIPTGGEIVQAILKGR
jgi:hypothetical protein